LSREYIPASANINVGDRMFHPSYTSKPPIQGGSL
jgi:hypothetical protein